MMSALPFFFWSAFMSYRLCMFVCVCVWLNGRLCQVFVITGMHCICQWVATKWQMMLTFCGCGARVCMHVMCQVMKPLTSRSGSWRRSVHTHPPSLTRFHQQYLEVCVCVCVLLFLWVLHCGLCACVCVASAAIFHPFWSPLRTCGTLCDCVCLWRCMHMYSWLPLCLCGCVGVHVCACAHLHSLQAFIHYHGEQHVCVCVCVLNVWWNFTRTEAHTHHATHSHSLFDKLDLELQEFALQWTKAATR